MTKKYKLVKAEHNYRTTDGKVLKRLVALKDFGDVKAGDFGGLVQSSKNLSQEGNCWIYKDAKVFQGATVKGNALVMGTTEIFGNAEIEGNAEIIGNPRIYGNAVVMGNAVIAGYCQVFNRALIAGSAVLNDGTFAKGNTIVSSGYFSDAILS